jgi:hypothetical protein
MEDQWARERFSSGKLQALSGDLKQQLQQRTEEAAHELQQLDQRATKIRRERFKWADKGRGWRRTGRCRCCPTATPCKQLATVEADA